ncbi:MAG: hypothetical protein IKR47_07155 [Lachnospiraceae bacterium]|nr:hypothetical protein [Lachnospiraceae bacterium]
MSKRTGRILWVLCILLVAAQTVIAAFYTIPHPVALRYLQDAVKTFETGQFQFASPVMSIWGLLCRLFHAVPMTFALKILPFVIIPACYGAYAFAVCMIPDGEKTAPVTLLLIAVLQIFGYQSEAFVPFTLLLGWYTGYALLVHFFLPLLLGVIFVRIKKHPPQTPIPEESAADLEDEDMKHKYLNVRNLAIVLVLFVIAATCALFVLNRKINNLHGATENLQQEIRKKGDVVEFRGALGDTCKGYIIVGSDGGLSVFFGGDEEDGPALLQQLAGYGREVDTWYLKEEEDGAYTYCVEQGISVDHVIRFTGMEEVQ